MLIQIGLARDWLSGSRESLVAPVDAQASVPPASRAQRLHAPTPRARVLIDGARGGAPLHRLSGGPLSAGPRAVSASQAVDERREETVVEELRRVAPGLGL